ncbi:MAG TPA: ribosomal-protein-alanine N-acetyltransferase [Ruminococcaceae bacterium]|nr:ribosomal-protein-alanine N-acetyltransferase [Oscillospiraceae bacterium]
MHSNHIEALARLEEECFSEPWSFESLANELYNPIAVFYVAEFDGEVCGYAGMHHIVDECYVTNIAVTKKHRRKGVATHLLKKLIAYAKEHDCSLITLEVRKSNTAAIGFYESNGFETEGERRDFYRNPTENALIMTLRF